MKIFKRISVLVLGFAIASAIPWQYRRITFKPELKQIENNPKNFKQKISYSGAQMWKVDADDEIKKNILEELLNNDKITTWASNPKSTDIVVKPDVQNHVAEILTSAGMNYQVMIPDLQKAIDEENSISNNADDFGRHSSFLSGSWLI